MDESEEAAQVLVDAVGPLYDSAGLARWLKLTENDIRDLARGGQLLAVTTLEGDLLFPAIQFGADGSLVPRLDEVVNVLSGTLEGWSIALWMLYEDPQDGMNAFERLRTGDSERVIQEATNQAEILRH